MALFKAFAGPSPSCWAVLVQIEHCAEATRAPKKEKQKSKKDIRSLCFIAAFISSKITGYHHSLSTSFYYLLLINKEIASRGILRLPLLS